MDLHSFFKLVHVIGAIAWVGGGMALIAQTAFGVRSDGAAGNPEDDQSLGRMATHWFLPSSALTLMTGLIAAYLGGMWSQAWIVLGFAGYAVTCLTGHFVLQAGWADNVVLGTVAAVIGLAGVVFLLPPLLQPAVPKNMRAGDLRRVTTD